MRKTTWLEHVGEELEVEELVVTKNYSKQEFCLLLTNLCVETQFEEKEFEVCMCFKSI